MRRSFGEHLKEITEQYQIAYVELDRELALDKVCDIFTQVNSKGIRLDVFDLINALVKPKGLQLKHMWRQAQPQLDFVETERMNVYILQVMSILRQAYCSPEVPLLPAPSAGEARFATGAPFAKRSSSGHRSNSRPCGTTQSTRSARPSTCSATLRNSEPSPPRTCHTSRSFRSSRRCRSRRRRCRQTTSSTPNGRSATGIGRASSPTATPVRLSQQPRATSSMSHPGSQTMTRSLRCSKNSAAVPHLGAAQGSRRGTSVYNGIFNLLVLRGARDWMTGNVPQYGDLDDHHIVPKDWRKNHPGARQPHRHDPQPDPAHCRHEPSSHPQPSPERVPAGAHRRERRVDGACHPRVPPHLARRVRHPAP